MSAADHLGAQWGVQMWPVERFKDLRSGDFSDETVGTIHRRVDPAHVAKLQASIAEHGVKDPPWVADYGFPDGEGGTYKTLFEGHHRAQAMLNLGMTEIPVHVEHINHWMQKVIRGRQGRE